MTRTMVLYYSMYAHFEEMARGVAEVNETEPDVKRVPELIPEDIARESGVKLDQEAPGARERFE